MLQSRLFSGSATFAGPPARRTPLPRATLVDGAAAIAAAIKRAHASLDDDDFIGSAEHARIAQVYASLDEQEAQGGQQLGDSWHAVRAGRLTASAVSKAVGLQPMCAAFACYCRCIVMIVYIAGL